MYVDVIIVYELRAREIENACLLAAELLLRGYSVKILCVLSLQRFFYRSKVVIVPHLYDDFQVTALSKNIWLKTGDLIDLQYEQVLSPDSDTFRHSPKDQGANAYHIAWGKAQFERYIKYGIKTDLIFTTGHVAMDLYRKEFDSYFLSKNDLAVKYHLDSSKKWILFTSSFSFANRTDQEIAAFEKLFEGAQALAEISDKTYTIMLNWIHEIAKRETNCIFIYRPHPGEKTSKNIFGLFEDISNFRIISDYSCRQWVKVCDMQYTWMSSSIVDSFYAKKPCLILRPLPLSNALDLDLMIDAHKISSFEEFCNSFRQERIQFPVPSELIEDYYGEIDQKPSYVHISDLCEMIIKRSEPRFHYVFSKSRFNILDSQSKTDAIKIWLLYFLFDICRYINLKWLNRIIKTSTIETFLKEGYQVDKEIKNTIQRFKKVLS